MINPMFSDIASEMDPDVEFFANFYTDPELATNIFTLYHNRAVVRRCYHVYQYFANLHSDLGELFKRIVGESNICLIGNETPDMIPMNPFFLKCLNKEFSCYEETPKTPGPIFTIMKNATNEAVNQMCSVASSVYGAIVSGFDAYRHFCDFQTVSAMGESENLVKELSNSENGGVSYLVDSCVEILNSFESVKENFENEFQKDREEAELNLLDLLNSKITYQVGAAYRFLSRFPLKQKKFARFYGGTRICKQYAKYQDETQCAEISCAPFKAIIDDQRWAWFNGGSQQTIRHTLDANAVFMLLVMCYSMVSECCDNIAGELLDEADPNNFSDLIKQYLTETGR